MVFGASWWRIARLPSCHVTFRGHNTGGVMPQNGTSYGDTRRRIHHHTCKSSHHGPSARWLNEVIHSGCQAATTRTSDGTCPRSSLTISLPRLVNGMASAADSVSSAGVTGGVTANRATSSDSVTESCNTNQSCPEPSLAVAAKKQRRRKKFPPKKSTPPTPPPKEEDWENEIQEVTSNDWERMYFGVRPYGPEDMLHFAFQDLTLKHKEPAYLTVIGCYKPAEHHPEPVRWLCHSAPTEPDQFSDADL